MALKNLYYKHWRDGILILTALLVAGSLILIAYSAASEKSQVACIARFFAQSDRQNKVVTNVSTCHIQFSK